MEQLSEFARLTIKKDSELHNTMIGNHLESCLQQKETKSKSKEHNKRLGKYNNKKKMK